MREMDSDDCDDYGCDCYTCDADICRACYRRFQEDYFDAIALLAKHNADLSPFGITPMLYQSLRVYNGVGPCDKEGLRRDLQKVVADNRPNR